MTSGGVNNALYAMASWANIGAAGRAFPALATSRRGRIRNVIPWPSWGKGPPVADYLVRFTDDEAAQLVERAAADGISVAALIRQDIGLAPMSRGGVREGAGRPKPKPKRTPKKARKKQ